MDTKLRQSLERIFFPRSIAVVGVSSRMDNPGTMLLRALTGMGFSGGLYPINPRYDEILDLRCFPDIASLPERPDLVILSIPPTSVPQLIREAAREGVGGCIINSAGFSETGRDEGLRLEGEILRAIEGSDLRIVGPNCMGIYSSRGRIALFAGMFPTEGHISMISQSGSMSSITYMTGIERGLYYDKIVSSGNELDLNCADYLEYLAEDPYTGMILAYLEEVRDARRFLDTTRSLMGVKPVIVLKAGLTSSGRKAAASHTSALGGNAEIFEGAARQAGIIPARDVAEMMDFATALYHLPPCGGSGVAVISSPGGLAVNAADAVEWYGLDLATPSEKTRLELADLLPSEGTSFSNPIDLGFGAVPPGNYGRVLELLDSDPHVDIMLAVGSAPASRGDDIGLLRAITDEVLEVKDAIGKPLVMVLFPSSFTAPQAARLHAAGVPAYLTPTAACKALREYCRFYRTSRDE
ncbi:MAG: CoA-binding protein [Actinomycetota bacterium]|nr:CoA-binding protein [Actinomycetota bacterium]